MGQKSGPGKKPAEQVVKEIRRATRRQFSAEEKMPRFWFQGVALHIMHAPPSVRSVRPNRFQKLIPELSVIAAKIAFLWAPAASSAAG